MISRMEKFQLNTWKKYFDCHQFIYGACIDEIIKQVSVDCKERGEFLNKVWDKYLYLFETVVKDQFSKINELENQNVEESTRIHRLYQKQVDITNGKN